jgi:Family of unknown function (DUF5670)
MIVQGRNNRWSELLTSLICGMSNAAQYRKRETVMMVSTLQVEETNMLWTIFVVLLILWLLGFSLHIAGGLIHLLLVVALVVLVINLVSGRRGVV